MSPAAMIKTSAALYARGKREKGGGEKEKR